MNIFVGDATIGDDVGATIQRALTSIGVALTAVISDGRKLGSAALNAKE